MEAIYKILLVEDEVKLSKVIQEELIAEGFDVDIALDGFIAEEKFLNNTYTLIILDISIPKKNGFELCKTFRETNSKIPIIMLTALGEIQDKIQAFNLGADDFIVKPFHFRELIARIKVFLKRTDVEQNEKIIGYHDLEVHCDKKTAFRGGKEIPLTVKEFTLLKLLLDNQGKPTSKQEILEKVWDLSFDTGTNTIEVYINFLRNKIDKPFERKLIYTKSGYGYLIK